MSKAEKEKLKKEEEEKKRQEEGKMGALQGEPIRELSLYGSGHETAAVLLPGFAIIW